MLVVSEIKRGLISFHFVPCCSFSSFFFMQLRIISVGGLFFLVLLVLLVCCNSFELLVCRLILKTAALMHIQNDFPKTMAIYFKNGRILINSKEYCLKLFGSNKGWRISNRAYHSGQPITIMTFIFKVIYSKSTTNLMTSA